MDASRRSRKVERGILAEHLHQHPDTVFTADTLAAATSINRDLIQDQLHTLATGKSWPNVVRVGHGQYTWTTKPTLKATEEPKPTAVGLMEVVGSAGEQHVLLRDEDGVLWVAKRFVFDA